MVQVGNLHFGNASTAQAPSLDSGETFLLWDQLLSRYDIIYKTQIYHNFAHDVDLKVVLKKGLMEVLEKQADKMEKAMNNFKLPMPPRAPKSVRLDAESGLLEDKFMFRYVFTGVQYFLDNHVRTIRSITTNDALREMFTVFAKQELDVFGDLCKFGKLKGWLQLPPSSSY